MSKTKERPYLGVPVTDAEALAVAQQVYHGFGKIEIMPKVLVRGLRDMAVSYTPGVGRVVRHLLANPDQLREQSTKANMIALVSDGTAVLGFGNIGPYAAIPVMEGKATMFKMLAGIDCMPLCVKARGPQHLIDIIGALEPSFGGFNIEDVAAPSCFELMRGLEEQVPVPALHDDQFGTATVITAGLINAFKVLGRDPKSCRVVVNGIGAAGTATIQMLKVLGVGDIIAVDRGGILVRGRDHPHRHWHEIAEQTNEEQRSGDLAAAMAGADAFVGVSVAKLVSEAMVRSMAKDPIVFGLANPDPEILPSEAIAGGAAIAASGRFDFPNQCNNVLAFPGIMRGALESQAKRVSVTMCLAASRAIAATIPDGELSRNRILPTPLSEDVHPNVADAVATTAYEEGLARVPVVPGAAGRRTRALRNLVAVRQKELEAFGERRGD